MKIFNKDGKMNFVDENNVFVGFDYKKDCCEGFGWRIDLKMPETFEFSQREYDESDAQNIGDQGINTEDWVFDTSFIFQRGDSTALDKGGAVSFRLMKDCKEAGFLTLWNSHNGYYSHGFQMQEDDLIIHDSSL